MAAMTADGEVGPRITLWLDDMETATLRRVKQLGVEHVCMGGPEIPWSEEELKRRMGLLEAGGLKLGHMMFGGYPRLIYPEHPPLIDADREHPFKGISSGRYTGFAYTVGYARAMLQAASVG